MNTSGNTVLITGGGSGIGLALAERFLKAGSEVIVCGRREEKLREAKKSILPYILEFAMSRTKRSGSPCSTGPRPSFPG